MTRLRGRSLRGEPLIDRVPMAHWTTITFVAALRHDEMVAPMVIEGAINAELFRAYVRQFLVPTLKRNDIVILDHLQAHKTPGECCAKLLDYPRALSRRAREPRTAGGYGDYPIYLMEPEPGSAP